VSLRLLMVAHNWMGEGTAVRALRLGQGLARRGHQVDLLATSQRPFGSQRYEDDGVRVFLAPHFRDTHRGGWGWLDLPWRAGFCLGHGYDLVHAFDHKPNVVLPAYIYRALKATPLVSDWADWWGKGGVNANARTLKAEIEEKAEERVRLLAGWVTAISPALAQRAQGLGLPADRVMLLPGGADTRGIQVQGQAAARKSLGLDPSLVYALYLGLGSTDLPLLLQGLALARAQEPRLRLLLLGPMPEQKMALAREAGVEQACIAPGRVPDADLSRWLAAADLGAIPLADNRMNQARWPNKVGEYLAAGLPVLSNPVGHVAEVLKDSGAGLLVPPSSEGFCDGLLALSKAGAGKAYRAKARQLAEGELSWDALAERCEGFYKRCMGPQAPQA